MASSSHAAPVVMIDNGSHQIRAGYAGEEGPRLVMPSLVGLARNKGVAMASGMGDSAVGDEAIARRGMLFCNQPFQGGIVNNWGDAERLWANIIFSELRIIPENHCFVLTQPALTPESQKEKLLELMLETFNAHSLYLGAAPVFSLYSYGLTTGLVVDSGLDNTTVVPIHEGYALGRHVTSSPIAGRQLTLYLAQLMKRRGYTFGTPVEMDLINNVKEELCFARNPFQTGGDMFGPTAGAEAEGGKHFLLPDGQAIPIDEQRYDCVEALFDFSILGEQYTPKFHMLTDHGDFFDPTIRKGLSWLAFTAINHCEPVLRPQLYNNIVLAGGSTSFPGTQGRLLEEVRQCYRETHPNESMIPISVQDMAARQYAAWLGGVMLSRTPMFHHLTVSRAEYAEHGHRIIHCKNL
jgi:actin-related protein